MGDGLGLYPIEKKKKNPLMFSALMNSPDSHCVAHRLISGHMNREGTVSSADRQMTDNSVIENKNSSFIFVHRLVTPYRAVQSRQQCEPSCSWFLQPHSSALSQPHSHGLQRDEVYPVEYCTCRFQVASALG